MHANKVMTSVLSTKDAIARLLVLSMLMATASYSAAQDYEAERLCSVYAMSTNEIRSINFDPKIKTDEFIYSPIQGYKIFQLAIPGADQDSVNMLFANLVACDERHKSYLKTREGNPALPTHGWLTDDEFNKLIDYINTKIAIVTMSQKTHNVMTWKDGVSFKCAEVAKAILGIIPFPFSTNKFADYTDMEIKVAAASGDLCGQIYTEAVSYNFVSDPERLTQVASLFKEIVPNIKAATAKQNQEKQQSAELEKKRVEQQQAESRNTTIFGILILFSTVFGGAILKFLTRAKCPNCKSKNLSEISRKIVDKNTETERDQISTETSGRVIPRSRKVLKVTYHVEYKCKDCSHEFSRSEQKTTRQAWQEHSRRNRY